ncbi:MAG: hypothetical protein HW406_1590 [Candidatus Brocadiaceae bacterium]|nr:hypothetical protein [Candidatus Brocadiaceae bacterium]
MYTKRVEIIPTIRLKFNKILIIISIAQHSIAATKAPPCVPPSQGGTQGGVKKLTQKRSFYKVIL